ncbi:YbgA family protein [Virgibacillus sp. SK37]|uniref:YbgA family protein n=1 Tax=Virgibacillus sp. SK37 TaxID=403957 RepID=UPI0004D157CE|nr:YbgA family protein [Virgibacillus sp. SK37]AIF44386.1 type II DNA modification enzyme [Virgibacillus sp. SK37]
MSSRAVTEKLWSQEKYRVMFHSQRYYNHIREALKQDSSLEEIKRLIDEAIHVQPTKGSVINTYQHMWGYFKKYATREEKIAFQEKLEQFQNEVSDKQELVMFIRLLAEKYQVDYLLNSTLLN